MPQNDAYVNDLTLYLVTRDENYENVPQGLFATEEQARSCAERVASDGSRNGDHALVWSCRPGGLKPDAIATYFASVGWQ